MTSRIRQYPRVKQRVDRTFRSLARQQPALHPFGDTRALQLEQRWPQRQQHQRARL
jgi:hypothetical protein